MTRIFILAAAAALTLSGPAFAQGDTAATGSAPSGDAVVAMAPAQAGAERASNARQSTTGDPNRRVCRTQTATGSRLGGMKVCKTAREWEEQRVASKQELDRMQTNRGLVGN
jgi:hypothetical protein